MSDTNPSFLGGLHQLAGRISAFYWLAKTQGYYRHLFGAIGARSRIIKPLKLRNPHHIFIGKEVSIADYVWLLTLPAIENRIPRMTIGDDCVIGHFNHITCVNSVEIGSKVLTADRVHISDNSHSFEDPSIPIHDQPVISKGPVEIGNGTWIGENVSILSCKIGRNCVVGANAVVTSQIPDNCVVAGVPGRIIKRFDKESRKWVKT